MHKIHFRFIMDRMPPGNPPEALLCPCCDPFWASVHETPLTLPASPRPGGPAAAGRMQGAAHQLRQQTLTGQPAPPSREIESDYSAALAGRRKKPTAAPAAAANAGAPIRQYDRGGGGVGGGGGGGFAPEGPAENCGCGVPSRQLTVSKEGPNKGRKFFSCAKSR